MSAGQDAAAADQLTRLDGEYFQVVHSADPLTATQLGVTGFDDLLPDPSRAGSKRTAARIAEIERALTQIDTRLLDDDGRADHAVMTHLAAGARSELEHGLWEANASADGYVSPAAIVFQSVPKALLASATATEGYLRRLGGLGGYFEAVSHRYRQAMRDGRRSTRAGVRQAIDQLERHLGREVADDPLVTVPLPADADEAAVRGAAAELVTDHVRPALLRLLDCLRDEMLPSARPDEQVGIRFVPGGEEGYRAAVRKHTTTGLSPEEIHQIGLDYLAALEQEWAELGRAALGTSDVPQIRSMLREDPALRFASSAQIVRTVSDALQRAEAARGQWFPALDIPECVVEEIDPVEAGNAPLAYYRPPAADGGRPGAHCVLTADPEQRFVYEYEALAFHESSPGHHLQIASAQQLAGLPEYRRFLDAEVCSYVEGWGLYCERLADEMGLYTSDLQRLGMLSFDALRAGRLVVDTGMHYFGWSRSRAIDFLWDCTATTRANVRNEVDRYIGWPGQALAYMIGRKHIQWLRSHAEAKLGGRFDIRGFHGAVLGGGAVPLSVLDEIVLTWVRSLHR
ncbi:MAG TPA: DUF885 domain-containing protein [Streptosporangiaceae bacterium]